MVVLIITMDILGYKEKKSHNEVFYLMALVFGVVCAALLLGGIKLLYLIINFLIKKWVWAVVALIVIVAVRHFMKKKSKHNTGMNESSFR
jgi:membrane protein implicated in regulation of membrane protease activity